MDGWHGLHMACGCVAQMVVKWPVCVQFMGQGKWGFGRRSNGEMKGATHTKQHKNSLQWSPVPCPCMCHACAHIVHHPLTPNVSHTPLVLEPTLTFHPMAMLAPT